jgi:hypothetical protein
MRLLLGALISIIRAAYILQEGIISCFDSSQIYLKHKTIIDLPLRMNIHIDLLSVVWIKLQRYVQSEALELASVINGAGVAQSVLWLSTDWTTGVRSPTEAEDFSSSLCVQTGSGAHPASCPMGPGGSFLGG